MVQCKTYMYMYAYRRILHRHMDAAHMLHVNVRLTQACPIYHGQKILASLTGPQLPNCQTQCHFCWLVVSPLRQKSTRSGNLVLAAILAF